PERGLEHQARMPDVPAPEALQDVRRVPQRLLETVPDKMRRFLSRERPFELRPVEPIELEAPSPAPPRRHIWMRAHDRLADEANLHRNLLAYMSDYQLLGTATLPHGIHFEHGNVQMASL